MEQEPTLVWLDSGLPFKPILEQSQWTRPRKQFGENSPDQSSDMQPAKNRVGARQRALKTTHKMNSAWNKRTEIASAE